MACFYICDENEQKRFKCFDADVYQTSSELLEAITAYLKGTPSESTGRWKLIQCTGITPALALHLRVAEWKYYSNQVLDFQLHPDPDVAVAYIAWANHPDNHHRALDADAFVDEYARAGKWEDFVTDLIRDYIIAEIPTHVRKYITVDRAKVESDLKERYHMIDRFIFRRI